jgi:uncharacterized protein (DUF885 family)
MSANGSAARTLVDEYWEGLLQHEPLMATEVGDERFDDRLADPGPEGIAARRDFQAKALADLDAIDRAEIEPVVAGALDIMEAAARRDLANIDAHFERLEAVSQMLGPGQLIGHLGSLQRADTPERVDRYVTRLRALPAYLDAYTAIMQEGVDAGQVAPRVVVERTVDMVERLVAAGVDGSPALQPVANGNSEGRDRVVDAIREAVLPAHQRYLDALREYLPRATETIGLLELPGGDAIYGAQILGWTSLALDPEEVHRIGLDELAAIDEERGQIASALGFASAKDAMADLNGSGRNEASSREELVRLAEDQVRRGWEAAPSMFGRLPSANCDVRAVEEFREAATPMAFYQPPSADGSRAGVYYINTSELPGRPLHALASVTYHEANPGHHFQIMLEQEIPDRPALRSFGGILAGSSFIEGWGLYSERLADEMGLYLDEYERLGMLDAQAWRACRLIVDTGIHAMGWDRQRAVDQMLHGAGVSRVNAEVEVDRYITMPGQALAYKIGQREIEGWRRAASEREGSAFDLKAFHDRLLAQGSLPLPALRRQMGD